MEVGNIKKYIQKYICFFPKKKRIRVSTFFSGVTNITSKSYVHPSIFFNLIFQCSHKSFVIFMYAFEYLIFPPVIIPYGLTNKHY